MSLPDDDIQPVDLRLPDLGLEVLPGALVGLLGLLEGAGGHIVAHALLAVVDGGRLGLRETEQGQARLLQVLLLVAPCNVKGLVFGRINESVKLRM